MQEKMIPDKVKELLKNAKPYEVPAIPEIIERSCNNCMDSIVCYGLDEPDDPSKGKSCPDWQLDFMEYQELLEKAKENK